MKLVHTLRLMCAGLGLAAGMMLASTGPALAAPVITTPVKWHPGHYYMLVGSNPTTPYYLDQVYSELEKTPALRGAVIRYEWRELEPTQGKYAFGELRQRMTELAAINKRLIILIETKTFDATSRRVPDYLYTSAYDGGVFAYGASGGSGKVKGHNLKLWNPKVRERFSALMRALGAEFNGYANFEGIGLQETAIAAPIPAVTKAQADGFYEGYLVVQKAMRDSFPNTMTFQYLNYPRNKLDTLIDGLTSMAGGVGCPDIFIEDEGLNLPATKYTASGLYPRYPKLLGQVPLVVQVEHGNYLNTKFDNSGRKPSVAELLNFGRDSLKVNYLFWTRTPEYAPAVLKLLNQDKQKANESGGLQTDCPSVFASCSK